jgi:heme/copper-type cytochrome/quinol oxidase subunit 1
MKMFWFGSLVWLLMFFYALVWMRRATLDIQVHDTMFVIAGPHVFAGFALLFGLAGCVYYWFPKLTGRKLLVIPGRIHFWVSFWGFLLFLLRAYTPILSRRYDDHANWISFNSYYEMGDELVWVCFAMLAAQALFIFNLVYSAVWGKKSSN